MQKILTVSGLTVSFEGETAVEDVSFELNEGESLAIIGPNGAGKSVFLRAIMGTVPYKGTVTWAKGARIGYVPQKIDADRHLPITFRNLLTSKAAMLGINDANFDEIGKTVGLGPEKMGTPVGHLSGGQFQRGLIAFALLGQPNVLILDEPTASIDKPGEEQIYELVHRLQEKFNMTVILVSHDLSFVYRYSTKVLCLNRLGLCFGAPDETLTPQVLEKLYGPHKYYHHFAHDHDER